MAQEINKGSSFRIISITRTPHGIFRPGEKGVVTAVCENLGRTVVRASIQGRGEIILFPEDFAITEEAG